MEAIALTSSILQLVHFSVDFFDRARRLYHSTDGSLDDITATEVAVSHLLKRVAELETLARNTNQSNCEASQLLDTCISVACELLTLPGNLKVKDKKGKWSTFKATAKGVWKPPEIDQLRGRLDFLVQGVQMDQMIEQSRIMKLLCDKIESVEETSEILRKLLNGPHSQAPRHLGYPWETGTPKDHIRIDDKLG
ncbi:hypothetical protein AJ80_02479 [Polytolypa hystricis UAMH7299]|uniref:Uncharacterized protein n=1 Tax=Polytolypa hystricis (strain UAMH7299) TaxID=1447883 RepID=A0A2B7YQE3_POLH7|nr:hypothetical protein AJ80_02479 [Polytolypa hystricis UAMH7299]